MNKDDVRVDQIETRLAQMLKPNLPPPDFRARLRNRLALAAHPRIVIERRRDKRLRLLISAVTIGSAAGLIIFALRARMNPKSS
ncbi:hypothetical protein ANRL3_01943 [Anaerolineae bacterium]|nr:hypothetical protein ANRL3_01943 [Anaerolineae bacterium]